jgi:hypothetical protein
MMWLGYVLLGQLKVNTLFLSSPFPSLLASYMMHLPIAADYVRIYMDHTMAKCPETSGLLSCPIVRGF